MFDRIQRILKGKNRGRLSSRHQISLPPPLEAEDIYLSEGDPYDPKWSMERKLRERQQTTEGGTTSGQETHLSLLESVMMGIIDLDNLTSYTVPELKSVVRLLNRLGFGGGKMPLSGTSQQLSKKVRDSMESMAKPLLVTQNVWGEGKREGYEMSEVIEPLTFVRGEAIHINRDSDEFPTFPSSYPVDLEIDGVMYRSLEQYFSSERFRGTDLWEEFLSIEDDEEMRRFAISNEGIDERVWDDVRWDVMIKGVEAKFSLPGPMEELTSTDNREIVNDDLSGDPQRPWHQYQLMGEDLLADAMMVFRGKLT
jgi:predicted NAD-dependent protein-ADP-ribosyltransferase YbiA (DUF1768 family)